MHTKIKNLLNLLRKKTEFNSKSYWETRYRQGGNSGRGSYGKLAEFKAKIINAFVKDHNIKTIIEFGCGDGNQLSMANYPSYIGLDVSHMAIKLCTAKFHKDKSKSFFLYQQDCFVDNHHIFQCELSLSLDVIYHLVEPQVYEKYLIHLFGCASRFVIIYSSNINISPASVYSHEHHRIFTNDVDRIISNWQLSKVIENEFDPAAYGDTQGSIANFYIYQKHDKY